MTMQLYTTSLKLMCSYCSLHLCVGKFLWYRPMCQKLLKLVGSRHIIIARVKRMSLDHVFAKLVTGPLDSKADAIVLNTRLLFYTPSNIKFMIFLLFSVCVAMWNCRQL